MDQQQNLENGQAADGNQTNQPRKGGSFWRVFWGIFTGCSVIGNILLLLAVIVLIGFYAAGKGTGLMEKVVREGDPQTKIAVINLKGVIDDENVSKFRKQLDSAREDKAVKGVIVRINSPGGSVSASDRTWNEIKKYRADTNEPAVAFMQQVAASGGYYAAVGCQKIVAEPTVITGSIGVITGYASVQELLEGKLGIKPVVIKAGEKKNWPDPFQPPSDEQAQYLQDRLVNPAYNRFKQVITESRDQLSAEDVNNIADGSIYNADMALELKMIDKVAYLEGAVSMVSDLAELDNPKVIEYQQPFSLKDVFSPGLSGALNFDTSKVFELTTPKVMYLWTM
jgi:protease-4